jgi:hypothetical protein
MMTEPSINSSVTDDEQTVHSGNIFIITGQIPAPASGKFIGRPVEEIITETATTQPS